MVIRAGSETSCCPSASVTTQRYSRPSNDALAVMEIEEAYFAVDSFQVSPPSRLYSQR